MALTKKLSLLCMSILTTGFVAESDLYASSNKNMFNTFNLNNKVTQRKLDLSIALDLMKRKSDPVNEDSYSITLLKLKNLNSTNTSFENQLISILNDLPSNIHESFVRTVQQTISKYIDSNFDTILNNVNRQHNFYQLVGINNKNSNASNDLYVNDLLKKFLDSKGQLPVNLISTMLMQYADCNNKIVNFITSCVLLGLDQQQRLKLFDVYKNLLFEKYKLLVTNKNSGNMFVNSNELDHINYITISLAQMVLYDLLSNKNISINSAKTVVDARRVYATYCYCKQILKEDVDVQNVDLLLQSMGQCIYHMMSGSYSKLGRNNNLESKIVANLYSLCVKDDDKNQSQQDVIIRLVNELREVKHYSNFDKVELIQLSDKLIGNRSANVSLPHQLEYHAKDNSKPQVLRVPNINKIQALVLNKGGNSQGIDKYDLREICNKQNGIFALSKIILKKDFLDPKTELIRNLTYSILAKYDINNNWVADSNVMASILPAGNIPTAILSMLNNGVRCSILISEKQIRQNYTDLYSNVSIYRKKNVLVTLQQALVSKLRNVGSGIQNDERRYVTFDIDDIINILRSVFSNTDISFRDKLDNILQNMPSKYIEALFTRLLSYDLEEESSKLGIDYKQVVQLILGNIINDMILNGDFILNYALIHLKGQYSDPASSMIIDEFSKILRTYLVSYHQDMSKSWIRDRDMVILIDTFYQLTNYNSRKQLLNEKTIKSFYENIAQKFGDSAELIKNDLYNDIKNRLLWNDEYLKKFGKYRATPFVLNYAIDNSSLTGCMYGTPLAIRTVDMMSFNYLSTKQALKALLCDVIDHDDIMQTVWYMKPSKIEELNNKLYKLINKLEFNTMKSDDKAWYTMLYNMQKIAHSYGLKVIHSDYLQIIKKAKLFCQNNSINFDFHEQLSAISFLYFMHFITEHVNSNNSNELLDLTTFLQCRIRADILQGLMLTLSIKAYANHIENTDKILDNLIKYVEDKYANNAKLNNGMTLCFKNVFKTLRKTNGVHALYKTPDQYSVFGTDQFSYVDNDNMTVSIDSLPDKSIPEEEIEKNDRQDFEKQDNEDSAEEKNPGDKIGGKKSGKKIDNKKQEEINKQKKDLNGPDITKTGKKKLEKLPKGDKKFSNGQDEGKQAAIDKLKKGLDGQAIPHTDGQSIPHTNIKKLEKLPKNPSGKKGPKKDHVKDHQNNTNKNKAPGNKKANKKPATGSLNALNPLVNEVPLI